VANTPEAPRQLISNRQTGSATALYRKQPPDSSDKSTKKKNGKEIKVVAEGQDEEKEESMRDRTGTLGAMGYSKYHRETMGETGKDEGKRYQA